MTSAPRPRTLRVLGAREHNLRDLDVEVALGQWIAVTGPSGSGKTSLVFDTIVAESQRHTLGALSARARHYLAKLARPSFCTMQGLPVAVAIGQRTAVGHARSTVGTLTGTLDLLRLLFARAAVDPGGEALTRSHFSFNHPRGACPTCQGLGLVDRVDPALLVADSSRSIRAGALVPTLANGYTVYSQVTLEVMQQICEAHGFSVHTPWSDLTDAQRDVVMYGTRALKVPFGKHGIESRMRWEGITARPREEGYYRGDRHQLVAPVSLSGPKRASNSRRTQGTNAVPPVMNTRSISNWCRRTSTRRRPTSVPQRGRRRGEVVSETGLIVGARGRLVAPEVLARVDGPGHSREP